MAGNAALPLFCDATGAVEEAQVGRFCELLHTRGFAIVRLPACAHAEAAAVRKAAGTFFALEKEEKRAVGDFRAIGDTYVGYRDTAATRQDCDAEFLEVRLERAPLGAAAAAATALAPNPSLGSPATRCTSTALASPSPTQAAAASARRRSPSSSAWRPSRASCCNCSPRTSTCRPAHSSRRSTRPTWPPLRFPRARSPPAYCASATTAAARSHRPRRVLRQQRARSAPPLLPLRVAGRRAGRRVWRFAGDCIPLYS